MIVVHAREARLASGEGNASVSTFESDDGFAVWPNSSRMEAALDLKSELSR